MLLLETPPDQHSLWEDVLGILTGTTLVALGIQFLQAAGLFTGQIAGLSLILSVPTGLTFGLLFFTLNLPFYILGYRQLGWVFTLKNFIAVTLMSIIAEALPLVLTINTTQPAVAALFSGLLAGMGLLTLFRHGATLGGVGIVALWLQDTRGIKAGKTQMLFDVFVFALALLFFPLALIGWSFLGAVIINVIITVNHRRDRYVARS
ncbi:MAG: YitT family protein [Paracoccaceae bacterium]